MTIYYSSRFFSLSLTNNSGPIPSLLKKVKNLLLVVNFANQMAQSIKAQSFGALHKSYHAVSPIFAMKFHIIF